jgi:hypothetical protein
MFFQFDGNNFHILFLRDILVLKDTFNRIEPIYELIELYAHFVHQNICLQIKSLSELLVPSGVILMESFFITGHQGVVVVEGVELRIIVTISFAV